MKKSLGIPNKLQGCHTAMVDGYYVEGHVPFHAIARLLARLMHGDGRLAT